MIRTKGTGGHRTWGTCQPSSEAGCKTAREATLTGANRGPGGSLRARVPPAVPREQGCAAEASQREEVVRRAWWNRLLGHSAESRTCCALATVGLFVHCIM